MTIRLPHLTRSAQAALCYVPPNARVRGTRYIPLNAVVEAIDPSVDTSAPAGATALMDEIANNKELPEGTRAFAAIIADKVRSDERLFMPIDFPNAVYEKLPGGVKVLAAKSLASKWGYDHIHVRHIMSTILSEQDGDTIRTAVRELRSAGIGAAIFLPELMMLYGSPTLYGLETLLGIDGMKELEATILILSASTVYALGKELIALHMDWRDRSKSNALLERIERLAEPAPHLAGWVVGYLKTIYTSQHDHLGPSHALMTRASIHRIERWNGESRPSRRQRELTRLMKSLSIGTVDR